LGYSLAQILKAAGHEVITCNLVNDRGIHICKSMYAWVLAGKSETPENTGLKGDHLVGKYYVAFDKLYKAQIKELMAAGQSEAEAEKNAPAILAAQEMLRKWESGDEETIKIWKTLNGWVYNGFDVTYKKLGVSFDKFYYESNTYLLGKELVAEGLESGAFFKKDDGSVWIDLTEEGLDEKLLLRADGTSVYITQDIGTAELKYADFGANKSIYVVGNEQDYHFKVLKLICKKLNKSYADGIFHLSYGMVELPHGKMKSREGTVVDADDLIAEMEKTAAETTAAAGKTEDFTPDELLQLYTTIGLGALKYFILKVDPKKKILFNPEESIDFHGNTGPFIQYTYARAKSVLRNAQPVTLKSLDNLPLNNFEKELILKAYLFKQVVEDAGLHYNPSIICNYTFELAKCFNQFYHECSILKEQDVAIKNMRLMLCSITAIIIKNAFGLLGINVPERM
jgi:arginyl-tRNA synthetase